MKWHSVTAVLCFVTALPLAAQLEPAANADARTKARIKQDSRPPATVSANSVTNNVPKYSNTTDGLTGSAIYEVPDAYGNPFVGLGTSDPKTRLHVYGPAGADVFAGFGVDPSTASGAFNFGYGGFSFGRASGFFNVRPDASAAWPNPSLRFMTGNALQMIITNTGSVGIAITPAENSPYKLHVNGPARFEGEVTGTLIRAHYQDVAEWVPASEAMPAGTVVVLNPEKSNEVMPSGRAYDTTVAGVVSAKPGVLLGESGPGREQIATTGRVKVRVDASRGPIRIGDLLVTGEVPGTAMKSSPVDVGGIAMHRPGTIIGKALEPLQSGEGEILVLLSLQ